MTDHPLNEAAAAEMWDEHHTPASPILRWSLAHESERKATLALLRAAHDAGREHERANPEDDRPWEPLNGGRVYVGDEVRQDRYGVTTTAVVGRVDDDGDPWATEDGFIGQLGLGTWYVRHPAQPLPPERDGVVLVPADGHESITTSDGQEFSRLTFTTKQSLWYGPNLAARPGDWVIQTTSPSRLTPCTWKEVDQ